MTKFEINMEINRAFNKIMLSTVKTKQDMINYVNYVFEKLKKGA